MKTETIINTGIVLAIIGFLCSVALLVVMRKDNPKHETPKEKKQEYDSCGFCRVVKQYSLNVNVHHYGDSVE
jgi:hypothetical protein